MPDGRERIRYCRIHREAKLSGVFCMATNEVVIFTVRLPSADVAIDLKQWTRGTPFLAAIFVQR
jgi:hypothetical protein